MAGGGRRRGWWGGKGGGGEGADKFSVWLRKKKKTSFNVKVVEVIVSLRYS